MLKPIMSRVRKGIKECFKEVEGVCEQLKTRTKEQDQILKENDFNLQKVEQDMRDIERNEQESRSQIQNLAQ